MFCQDKKINCDVLIIKPAFLYNYGGLSNVSFIYECPYYKRCSSICTHTVYCIIIIPITSDPVCMQQYNLLLLCKYVIII